MNKGNILPVVKVKASWDEALYSEDPLETPYQAVELVSPMLMAHPNEMACVIYCNSMMIPVCVGVMGLGSHYNVEFDCRDILQMGLLCNASQMIILHNHPDYAPGGKSLQPSREDIIMTDKISRICSQLGIYLYDSIIVSAVKGKNGMQMGYYSIKTKQGKYIYQQTKQNKVPLVSLTSAIEKKINWGGSGELLSQFWDKRIQDGYFFKLADTPEKLEEIVKEYEKEEKKNVFTTEYDEK